MQATDAGTRRLTFLFADVEGSTRLAELHGAAAGAAHVSNILGKLGVASRTQAALWAVEHKLA